MNKQLPPIWLLKRMVETTTDSVEEWNRWLHLWEHARATTPPKLTKRNLRDQLPLLPETRNPIGREEIIGEVRSLIASGSRLIAIVGEPGIGKSTVAIEVARREVPRF